MTQTGKRREQAAVLALVEHAHGPWHLVAQLVESSGSALSVLHGESALEAPELWEAAAPSTLLTEQHLDELETMIEKTEQETGGRLITVLDDDYPVNLRPVYDRPPFLFVRGRLEPGDAKAIAVVGTRRASPEGRRQAEQLSRGLVERDVTVVSGLALGIDSAAHAAALDAGGRTIAVMGTGIRLVYPRQNEELAERIVEAGGALVSQFFPDAPPTRWRFPLRNRTTSGMAKGTVVVEASSTSGARMQARIALEHQKRVFLVSGLVTREPWAQKIRTHPGVTEVTEASDVLAVLDTIVGPSAQLTLAS